MQNKVEHVDETSGEAEGLIKTPRQLVTVIILAFLIPIIGILLLVKLVAVTSPMGAGSRAQSSESIAERIQPVAGFKLVAAADEGGEDAARTGEQVYELTCATCHATGVAGAPTMGDNAAWAPLIESGFDEMVRIAIEGKGAMPPRGGNPALSDLEIARAVAFMANNSGGSFDEPSEDGAAASGDATAAAEAPAAESAPEQQAAADDAAAESDAAAETAAADAADATDAQADVAAADADQAADATADAAAAASDAPGIDEIQPILAKNACLACHAVENKLVGPSYREVAEKYEGEAGASETIAQHIKGGSSGIWGPIPMPPNPGVTDDELAKIVSWIMAGAPE
ncbi:MAG TPA: c-type cytochrome [Burkholderiaceae bacterium]|nr:c-type cytochrome [Burkholderiaceae bacterium]